MRRSRGLGDVYKRQAPAAPAAPATPAAPALNPQPICATIIGALFNDDKILSVAHQFQTHNDVASKRPTV
jgi:hypothetical protein